MIDLNRVFENLKDKNPNGFLGKDHFQVEFGYAFKNAYPEYELLFGMNLEYGQHIDLIARTSKETIGFTFQYFTKEDEIELNRGLKVYTKISGSASQGRITFWKNVSKMERLSMVHAFDYGYCILLTNNVMVFEPIKALDRMDREYDLSDGLRPMLNNLHYYDKNNRVANRNDVFLMKNDYEIHTQRYGYDFYLLPLEIH